MVYWFHCSQQTNKQHTFFIYLFFSFFCSPQRWSVTKWIGFIMCIYMHKKYCGYKTKYVFVYIYIKFQADNFGFRAIMTTGIPNAIISHNNVYLVIRGMGKIHFKIPDKLLQNYYCCKICCEWNGMSGGMSLNQLIYKMNFDFSCLRKFLSLTIFAFSIYVTYTTCG